MFAEVNLIQSKDVPPVVVPGEAIVVRNGKNVVALLENDYVHLRPVTIGRGYGDETEITSGLKPGAVVALNVSDEVPDGAKIQPQFAKEQSQQRGGQTGRRPNSEGQYGNENQSNQDGNNSSEGKHSGKGKTGKQGGSAGQSKQ